MKGTQTAPEQRRTPLSVRGARKALMLTLASCLLAVSTTSCYPIYGDEEFAVYHYTVKLYYLDGGTKTRTFDTNQKPYISSGYKDGFPRFYWRPMGEWQEYMENGVCRFEVISKRDITEEYYSKKIVSSREYWNPFTYEGGTLHKLTEKGGEL